jgi:hypothetical protein
VRNPFERGLRAFGVRAVKGNQRPWFGRQFVHVLAFVVEARFDSVTLLEDRKEHRNCGIGIAEQFADMVGPNRFSPAERRPSRTSALRRRASIYSPQSTSHPRDTTEWTPANVSTTPAHTFV